MFDLSGKLPCLGEVGVRNRVAGVLQLSCKESDERLFEQTEAAPQSEIVERVVVFNKLINRFSVPKGVENVTAHIWGAGGSGAEVCGERVPAGGGAGAFIKATINVAHLQSLVIVVGSGTAGVDRHGSPGGGGWSVGGSGGGLSGVFYDDHNFDVHSESETGSIQARSKPLIVVGGGGAGGYAPAGEAASGGGGCNGEDFASGYGRDGENGRRWDNGQWYSDISGGGSDSDSPARLKFRGGAETGGAGGGAGFYGGDAHHAAGSSGGGGSCFWGDERVALLEVEGGTRGGLISAGKAEKLDEHVGSALQQQLDQQTFGNGGRGLRSCTDKAVTSQNERKGQDGLVVLRYIQRSISCGTGRRLSGCCCEDIHECNAIPQYSGVPDLLPAPNDSPQRRVIEFDSSKPVHNFTVPFGVFSINAYVWAGGGRAWSCRCPHCGGGGAGGFVKAKIDVRGLDSLKIVVGLGGDDSRRRVGKGGGGMSGIFQDDENFKFLEWWEEVAFEDIPEAYTLIPGGYVAESAVPMVVAGGGGAGFTVHYGPGLGAGGCGGPRFESGSGQDGGSAKQSNGYTEAGAGEHPGQGSGIKFRAQSKCASHDWSYGGAGYYGAGCKYGGGSCYWGHSRVTMMEVVGGQEPVNMFGGLAAGLSKYGLSSEHRFPGQGGTAINCDEIAGHDGLVFLEYVQHHKYVKFEESIPVRHNCHVRTHPKFAIASARDSQTGLSHSLSGTPF